VDVTFIECDLTSLDSVQKAAKEFLMSSPRLDVLMCNAGIMAVDADTSKDGYEIQFQVNHLAHALLIKLLAPLMLQTAGDVKNDVRIINLSSTAYQQAPNNGIDFETLKSSQPYLGNFIIPGHKWARYAQSKLANLLYPQALAKRYPEILSVAVHPGIIMTDLFNNIPFTTRLPALLANLGSIIPIEEGPYNQLWAATCPRSNLQSGEYYESIGIVGKRTTRQSKDMSLAESLWDWTEKSLEPFS
jgi:NAD(P)-dependent dehydrogenase (short-subunit alcohol dehydrogenase family)